MWKVGHSLIKAKMKEEKAALAGEMSGHMFFADRWFGFDDAVYAGMRLVELLTPFARRRWPSSTTRCPVLHNTPEIRMPCPDDVKFEVVRRAVAWFRERYSVVDVDGVRVMFEDRRASNVGWGLVRASNTGPVLVMRFEADGPQRLAEIKALMEGRLRQIIADVTAATRKLSRRRDGARRRPFTADGPALAWLGGRRMSRRVGVLVGLLAVVGVGGGWMAFGARFGGHKSAFHLEKARVERGDRRRARHRDGRAVGAGHRAGRQPGLGAHRRALRRLRPAGEARAGDRPARSAAFSSGGGAGARQPRRRGRDAARIDHQGRQRQEAAGARRGAEVEEPDRGGRLRLRRRCKPPRRRRRSTRRAAISSRRAPTSTRRR